MHPRLPALSGVGTRDRQLHVRPGPRDRGAERRLQGHLPRPRRRPASSTRSARTAVSSRPCSCTRSSTTSSTPRSCRTSKATAPRGRRSPASRARAPTSSRRPAAATRTPRTRSRTGSRKGRRAHRARRHVVPVVDPAGDEATQGGQGRAPARAEHRPAVLEDVRRRDLRRALRSEVRLEEGRHQEDEHQRRLPDLDEQRRLPRGAAEGVPPVDA